MSEIKKQQGVTLYLSLTIMTILLAMAFGLSTIFINQIKMIKEMGHSVIALCAADTGVEAVLVDRGNPSLTPDFYSGVLSNGATYQVVVAVGGAGDCLAEKNYCIKSVGSYLESRRAIEITY